MGYARSPFRGFERYLRFVVDLDEDEIQRILKQNTSYFVTCEVPTGIYTIEDIAEVV